MKRQINPLDLKILNDKVIYIAPRYRDSKEVDWDTISEEFPWSSIMVDKAVEIPAPRLQIKINPFSGEKSMTVNWHTNNLNFLNYDPKYYLFRYRGRLRKNNEGGSKGFVHPVHLNGATATSGSGWWKGESYYQEGGIVSPRETEWAVPVTSAPMILPLNKNDWVYCKQPLPADIEHFRVMGCAGRNTRTAYFYLRVGLVNPDPEANRCPVLFGPESEVFYLRPSYNHEVSLWTGWSWGIVR